MTFSKKAKTGVPSRRSSRHKPNTDEVEDGNQCELPDEDPVKGSDVIEPSPIDDSAPLLASSHSTERLSRPSSRTSSRLSLHKEKRETFEGELFDILSTWKVKTGQVVFDEEFYNDQKGLRLMWIS